MGNVKYFSSKERCITVFCFNLQRAAFQTVLCQLCFEVVKIFGKRFGKVSSVLKRYQQLSLFTLALAVDVV